MELFEALTRIRRSQNLTIADVSQRSGLPMSTLSKVFSGISDNPSYTAIVKIATALGVTPNDISAMQRQEQPTGYPYSWQALELARQYDTLDILGQQFIKLVMEHELYRTSSDTQAGKALGRAEEQCPRGSDIIPTSQAQEIDQTDAEAAR